MWNLHGEWHSHTFRFHMRRLFIFLLFAAASTLAWGAPPALLNEALQGLADNFDHWAYTHTIVQHDGKGENREEAVIRFDPSKPYAEQFTPIKINGREPTEKDREKYRRDGEKRGERLVKGEESAASKRKTLGELMDIDRATVDHEDEKTVTYVVPLKKEGNLRLPPDKFRVLARVSKVTRGFERVDVQVLAPFRVRMIIKVKSGDSWLDFASVDPDYPPVLVGTKTSAKGSVLFIGGEIVVETSRADFKRVKPFSDRFGVKVGPLKSIDF